MHRTTDPTPNPSTLRKALGNLNRLLAGRAFAGVLGLVATAIMARALAPEQFGLVILLHTYLLTWQGLLNCKPFEAIIRYGVDAVDAGDETRLRRLLKLSLRVDVVSSLLAAILAAGLAGVTGRLLGWDPAFIGMAQLYSLLLLTSVTGTAKGVLRLFNRFDLLARQLAIAPALRFVGALFCWWQSLGLTGFIVTWGLALGLEHLYMTFRGWRELNRQLDQPTLHDVDISDWREAFPGYAKFTGIVYWQSNLDLLPKHLVTLVVGAFLGPMEAGLYRLARELSQVLQTPAVLIRQVLFPDFTRLWNRGGDGLVWILLRTVAGAALGGLVFVVVSVFWGDWLLGVFAGDAYVAAAVVLTWLLVAGTLDLCTSVLRVAGYAMGDASVVLRLTAIAAAAYLLALLLLVPVAGLVGAGLSACVASLTTLTGMVIMVRRRWTQQRTSTPVGGGTGVE
ncbi:MAG: lipopolysaccharide biosynthesis protein [Pseudomonadales bacterium]